jgi:hypothetical protein
MRTKNIPAGNQWTHLNVLQGVTTVYAKARHRIIFEQAQRTREADKSLALQREQATALQKMHLLYICLLCSNFFNPSKKNSFGCAANRKIGKRKSQRLITYQHPYIIRISAMPCLSAVTFKY